MAQNKLRVAVTKDGIVKEAWCYSFFLNKGRRQISNPNLVIERISPMYRSVSWFPLANKKISIINGT